MSDIEARLRDARFQGGALPDLTAAFTASGLADVAYAELDSILGRILLAATERGLIRVAYVSDEQGVERTLDAIAAQASPRVLALPRRLDPARRQIDEFLAGKRRDFDLELDWRGIEGFRRQVLEATARIPFGQTLSYAGVATQAGNPKAYRAAGNALGSNPLPIVVPCHRILHSGGGIGGYTGGLEIKRTLLRIEDSLPAGE